MRKGTSNLPNRLPEKDDGSKSDWGGSRSGTSSDEPSDAEDSDSSKSESEMDESDNEKSSNDMDIDILLSRARSKQELGKMLKVCLFVFQYYYGVFCIYF